MTIEVKMVVTAQEEVDINWSVAQRRPAVELDIFWIVFTQEYTNVKTHQSVHLIFVHINIYKPYLNKREKWKNSAYKL